MTTSDPDREAGTDETGAENPDIDQLQASIERTREELGETVDALTAKLDVKSRINSRVTDTKNQAAGKLKGVRAKTSELTTSARDSATDDQGKPKPVLIAVAAGLAAVLVTAIAVAAYRRRR